MSLQAPKLDRTIQVFNGDEVKLYLFDYNPSYKVYLNNDQTRVKPTIELDNGFFNIITFTQAQSKLPYCITYKLNDIEKQASSLQFAVYYKDNQTKETSPKTIITLKKQTQLPQCNRAVQTFHALKDEYEFHISPGSVQNNIDDLVWAKGVFIKNAIINKKVVQQVVYSTPALIPIIDKQNNTYKIVFSCPFTGDYDQVYLFYTTRYGAAHYCIYSTSELEQTGPESISHKISWYFQPAQWMLKIGFTSVADDIDGLWNLYASSNYGQTWTQLNSQPFILSTIALYLDYEVDFAAPRLYKVVSVDNKYIAQCEVHFKGMQSLNCMYLARADKTLALKFNPELTNLKWNYQDAITPTLGGAYPIVRRNGAQQYRTFTIGGMISYLTDYENNTLLTGDFLKASIINNTETIDSYAKQAFRERNFRDEVIKFLHSADPVIFKSFQEGVMIVRLSNISLTSEKGLDRNIYSFSATATEIMECNHVNITRALNTETELAYIRYFAPGQITGDQEAAIEADENGVITITQNVIEI